MSDENIFPWEARRRLDLFATSPEVPQRHTPDPASEPGFHAYPKWKYHRTEAARIVASKAEEDALGPGWYDRPDLAEASR